MVRQRALPIDDLIEDTKTRRALDYPHKLLAGKHPFLRATLFYDINGVVARKVRPYLFLFHLSLHHVAILVHTDAASTAAERQVVVTIHSSPAPSFLATATSSNKASRQWETRLMCTGTLRATPSEAENAHV